MAQAIDGSSGARASHGSLREGRAASASISASGCFWPLGLGLPLRRAVVGVHVGGVVLTDSQHQLHVPFSDRIHRRIGLAAWRRGREHHEADRDPGCPRIYRTRVPGAGGSSKLTSIGFPPSGLAASTIPFDSMPISFAGFRLTTMTTVRPTSASGSYASAMPATIVR